MKSEALVLREKRENIGWVWLNRPEKRNALSTKVRDALEEALRDYLEEEVQSVVLSSKGDFFCAGFDLKEVVETRGGAFSHRFSEFHRLIYTYPKPIVVAVRGGAFAGGLDLMLCGDFVFATPEALFSAPEVLFGLNPFISVLRRRMGLQRAYQFALTGERLKAEQAEAVGLIDEVVPSDELEQKAQAQAEALAQIPKSSVRMLKKVLQKSEGLSLQENLELEIQTHLEILQDKKFMDQVETYFANLRKL